ncbi:MAG: type II toxin-antitoxin system PemK/MazF family toxin [Mobilicoccus sp.]|nr:type II toxin-antitoxin system PemK/MazF family toxin [Mobilicoccus sp.]
MKRGEVWTVAGGVYASTPRPALILQDDHFEGTASVTVAPLTTVELDASHLRVHIDAGGYSGLRSDSTVMIDKITTVRRTHVHQRVGRLTSTQLVEVERALMTFLGLAR